MTTTQTLTSQQIRQQYLDFFVQKAGHTAVPSAPVVPHDDPTLLFTNAGMNQFKDVFLGTGSREYTRAVDTQKCIRAGGKHNDLDDVGKDTYHHTFFEMLGNWSFGDYFKKQAIDWAWELLTSKQWWGIDPERLYATYFEGDASEGLEPDYEARDLWLQYLPEDHVLPGNKKDNFWEMGDTGPCGPCSEIHYDGRPASAGAETPGTPETPGRNLVNNDHPNVIEIWNLVFIQFNRNQDQSLSKLPARHVDTGMGFERIVRVLQGKDSNYDTDVFTPIFAAIKQATGARDYTPGGHEDALKDPINIAYRVIADHIRTLTFALSDGAHCGNEGRNYVLRSILRRAVRYGKQALGVEEPFFYKLVAAVVENFGEVFPEIKKKQREVEAELKEEEESFRRTLDRGISLFDQVVDRLAGATKSPTFPGEDAFKLHDTYGFPIGLTQVMAEERGLTVDLEGFEREMERAREISRGGEGSADVKATLTEFVQQNDPEATQFLGYTQTESPVTVTHIVAVSDNEHAIVLDQTPFYAEQGGQVGDRGEITTGAVDFEVQDTQKIGDVYFHLGQFHKGIFDEGTQGTAKVKADRRALIQSNHTITHIMNRALRDHVSPDAMQKGSLVDDEKTRFDFSHNAALTPEQLELVEKQVNDDIAKDLKVYDAEAPQEDALKINGLRAVFGEKYPPKVRVVSVGVPVADLLANPGNSEWANYSIEFCGGTHLEKTGDAEGFVVISQDAVSKGVRRVTALTGPAAHKASAIGQSLLSRIESLHDAPADRLETAIADVTTAMGEAPLPLLMKSKILAGLADLTERVKDYKKAQGGKLEEQVIEEARAVADATDEDALLVVAQIPGADAKTLRTAMDVIRKKRPGAAMLLAADAGEGKVALLAAVPKELIDKGLKAGDWVKHTAPIVGGGGGGRPDMAQAGGKDPAKIEDALEAARQFAQDRL